MKAAIETFERDFICPKCHGRGAAVEEVQLKRTVARMIPLATSSYLAVSCALCGYTELYQSAIVVKATEEIPGTVRLADKPEST